MSTVAAEIQRLQASKAAIKAAIEAKGVTVGNGTIDTYASKVDAIQTGGVVGTGTYLVRFFDFDGTILKQQRVNAGENATAPTVPTHQYLTFNSWNNAFTNVQSDIDTGAIYDTTDGKSYLFITLTAVTGLSPTLYFNKSTTSLMTINWGDGTTSTSTTAGNQNINHTYAVAGNYVITVQNSAGGTYRFSNGGSSTMIFGAGIYKNILTCIYFGANITNTMSSTFWGSIMLERISLSPNITDLGTYFFNSCESLSHVNMPSGITTIGDYLFSSCYSLVGVILSINTNSINTQVFYMCVNLKFIDINKIVNFGQNSFWGARGLRTVNIKSVVTINNNAFRENNIKSIHIGENVTSLNGGSFRFIVDVSIISFKASTPPTMADIYVFEGINPICKIYVPDASVNAYKTATNWVTYANYIYPLSQLNS